MDKSALVVFGEELPRKWLQLKSALEVVLAKESLREDIEASGVKFVSLESFIEAGSIYEASALAEELSYLKLPDGTPVAKSFIYKGYELWWMYYTYLFLYYCLPYTQYRKLLEHLKNFKSISLYRPPYASLFSCYFTAWGSKVNILRDNHLQSPSTLPLGVFFQIMLTFLSLPFLLVGKRRSMVFTGDKIEKTKDYDFRMRFVYPELRQKKMRFVEFIRSLESWRTVLQHAFIRKRPVIYSEAVVFVGRFCAIISRGRSRGRRKFGPHLFVSLTNFDTKFKLAIATQFLLTVYDDVWAIRIMKWLLRSIGIKAAFIPAATERNFHAVLGCKLNSLPTVGIMHGVQIRHYNVYDFLPGFNGEKMLTVDRFGVWSEWWKEYYVKNSKAYRSEQLFVSGPMRPLEKSTTPSGTRSAHTSEKIHILLVSEIVAVPQEVIPYLETLLGVGDFSLHIKFRSHNDSFEGWLKANRPDILEKVGKEKLLKGSMQEAIEICDVVVGSQSTGVIEATLQDKPFVFFNTKKWGDYYDMKSMDTKYHLFAENPEELIRYVKESKKVPQDVLRNVREKFFGDPYKNGSKWVVEQLEQWVTSASK